MAFPFSIKLNNQDRDICLVKLDQVLTYQGLIEGLPTTQMNERIVQSAMERATELSYGGTPFLIQPTETPIAYCGGKYPFGEPAGLPSVMCRGVFMDVFPARDESKDYSELVVVWFQNEFALPLSAEVESHIKTLNWDNLAHDFEY